MISTDGLTISYDDLKTFCYDLSLNLNEDQIQKIFSTFILHYEKEIRLEDFEKILSYSLKVNRKKLHS